MRVAHFVQRYPPALGGSEAYFARLSRHLAAAGDDVTVFTTNALDLEAFWSRRGRCLPPGVSADDGVEVRRYAVWRLPAQRWLLKPLSYFPHDTWRLLCMGHNPLAPGLWRAAGRRDRPFDVVHATAFPYGWPLACALRLGRRSGRGGGRPPGEQQPREGHDRPAAGGVAGVARRGGLPAGAGGAGDDGLPPLLGGLPVRGPRAAAGGAGRAAEARLLR